MMLMPTKARKTDFRWRQNQEKTRKMERNTKAKSRNNKPRI